MGDHGGSTSIWWKFRDYKACVDLGYSIIAVADPGEAKVFQGYRLISSDSAAIQEYPGIRQLSQSMIAMIELEFFLS